MTFVLDASVTARWAFQDEDHAYAGEALERMRSEEAIVPALWWFEVRNILVVHERRQRICEADRAAFLRNVAKLRIRADRSPDEAAVLRRARSRKLSVYDAAYLELAQRGGAPLATLDTALRVATAEGVPWELREIRMDDDERPRMADVAPALNSGIKGEPSHSGS